MNEREGKKEKKKKKGKKKKKKNLQKFDNSFSPAFLSLVRSQRKEFRKLRVRFEPPA